MDRPLRTLVAVLVVLADEESDDLRNIAFGDFDLEVTEHAETDAFDDLRFCFGGC